MISGEEIREFCNANKVTVISKELIDNMIQAVQSLKCPEDNDLIEATNHMNDCCVEVIKRYLGL